MKFSHWDPIGNEPDITEPLWEISAQYSVCEELH
jgi:hypothetical protein